MEQFYLSSAQHCAKSVLYEIIPTNLLEALEILEHLHGGTVTFDEESQNMPVWLTKVVLAQHNCSLLVNGAVMLYTWIKECTKYIRLPLSISDSPIINDWSRWFAISSSPPICYPSFSVMAGVAKKYITKLGCEKYFCGTTADALRPDTLGP
jgi:hypothetical protein